MSAQPGSLAGLREMPAAVLELAADGRIVDSNGRLEEGLGGPVVGWQFGELLDAASRAKFQRMLRRTVERKPPRRWEFVFAVGPTSSVRAFTPVRHADGNRLWLVDADLGSGDDTLYDVLAEANSELVTAQRELTREKARLNRALTREAEARNAADAAVRRRDDVLAIVSHDLRNPIGAIHAAASSLLDFGDRLTAEGRRRQLGAIRRASARAMRLIEDLLDIARLESGNVAVEPVRVDLAALLDEVCQLYEDRLERGIRIVCTTSDAPPHIVADPHRLHQALSNLIDNAVRYSPDDGVVDIVATASDGHVRIDVRDRGPGIPADEIGQLFERFWQASRSGRGGAGLGLAIVRGIAEAHGGRVDVSSRPGEGATFSLTLPRSAPDRPSPPEPPGIPVAPRPS